MAHSEPNTDEPNVVILYDTAALNALKRPQLVALCRVHAIKASGKNVELVHKLVEHGQQIRLRDQTLKDDQAGGTSWRVVDSGTFQQEQPTPLDSSSSFSSRDTILQPDHIDKRDSVNHRPAVGLYPSLSPNSLQSFSPKAHQSHMSVSTAGTVARGTRYVGSVAESPVKPSERVDDQPGNANSTRTQAFVFGSAVPMPGSTFTFTAPSLGKSVAQQVVDEMNSRVAASGFQAAAAPVRTSASGTSRIASSSAQVMATKLADFNGKHKRVFDRMDSITSHYAAKRKRPLSTEPDNPVAANPSKPTRPHKATAPKRTKLSSSLSRSRSSTSNSLGRSLAEDKKIVSGLLGSGWATSSARGKAITNVEASTSAKANFKRQLELAKARRKSQVTQVGPHRRKSFVVKPLRSTQVTSQARHLVAVSTPPRPAVATRATGPSRLAVDSPMTALSSTRKAQRTTTPLGPITGRKLDSGFTSPFTTAVTTTTTKPRPFSFASASRSRTLPKSASLQAVDEQGRSSSQSIHNVPNESDPPVSRPGKKVEQKLRLRAQLDKKRSTNGAKIKSSTTSALSSAKRAIFGPLNR
ncbi:hypothetical protein ACM66B_001757 [Microbotryomycetes sp. NB124-2]